MAASAHSRVDAAPRYVDVPERAVYDVGSTAIILAGVVVFVVIDAGLDTFDLAVVFSLATCALACIELARSIANRRIRFISAVFWLFVLVAMGLAPLAQMGTGIFPPSRWSESDWEDATLLVFVTALAFALGSQYMARRQRATVERLRVITDTRRRWIFTISVLLSLNYIRLLDGPGTFFLNREAREAITAKAGLSDATSQVGSALWGSLGSVPILLALVLEIDVRLRSRRPFTWPERLRFFTLIALNVLVNNPISNSRYWFLAVAGAIGFTILKFYPRWIRPVFTLGVVAAVAIFPYADVTRTSNYSHTVAQVSVSEKLASKDYDQLSMVANGMAYVRERGFSNGEQLLGVVGFAVPRSVWEGKPTDTGVLLGNWIAERERLGTTNLSAPLWIESYLNFGWLITIALFAALGILIAAADGRFASEGRRRSRSVAMSSVVSISYPVVAGYMFILLRGSLLQATARAAFLVLASALLFWRTELATSDEP